MTSQNYIIELLDKNQKVQQRWCVDKFPATIGRGYDNTIILDDPYCAVNHAQLQQSSDGVVQIQDCGSKNGLMRFNQEKAQYFGIQDEWLGLIGQSVVRIRPQNFVHQPEQVLGEKREMINNLHSIGHVPKLLWVVLSVLLAAGLAALSAYIGAPPKLEWKNVILSSLGFTAVIIVWGAFWGFVGRVVSGESHFYRHILRMAWMVIAMFLIVTFCEWLAYSLNINKPYLYIDLILSPLLIILIYKTVYTVKPIQWAAFSAALVCAAFLTWQIYEGNHNKPYYQDAYYVGVLKPPATRISPDEPLEDFLGEVKQMEKLLQKDLDKK